MSMPTIDLPDPLDIARSGAVYLASLVSPSGRFRYRFDHKTWADFGGYNVVRHCGTIWSMCDVANRINVPYVVPNAIERSVDYLRHVFLRRPATGDAVEDQEIKLGANALAVLALLGAAKVLSKPELVNIAVEVGEAILKDQKADGDFIHKINHITLGPTRFYSEYYTGEAMLALMELHAVTGQARWLNAVIRAEDALAPKDYGVKEQSHWMLYALEALSRFRDEPADHAHATKIVQNTLSNPAYLTWNRSTPTACRSEGLLAFLRMSQGRPESAKLGKPIRARVRQNLAAQLLHRQPDGAFLRGGVATDARSGEVRIDYVQHNISAFLRFGVD